MYAQARPSPRTQAGTDRPARFLAIRAIAQIFERLVRAWRIRHTAVALERLDDRTLADIGLDRTRAWSTARALVDGDGADPRYVRRDA